MEKRGQAEVLQITLLFELIAGVLIAGILVYAVMSMNDASQISEEYLKTDYNLISGILQGKPGDFTITYPTGTFTVKDNQFQKPDGVKISTDNKATIKKDDKKVGIS
ncbi:MAG: hypothetical protein V1645_02190 [archaeon]